MVYRQVVITLLLLLLAAYTSGLANGGMCQFVQRRTYSNEIICQEISVQKCSIDETLNYIQQSNKSCIRWSRELDQISGLTVPSFQTFSTLLNGSVNLKLTKIPELVSIDNIKDAGQSAKNKWELKELRINYCGLTSIDSGVFDYLPNLSVLDLHSNRLTSLDFRNFYWNSLKVFDASMNEITDLFNLRWQTFYGLTDFNMSDNKLTDRLILSKLPNSVKVVNLQNNLLSELGNASGENLEELLLSNNHIRTISSLLEQGSNKLRILKLDDNQLNLNSFVFRRFPNLEVLDLHNTGLSQITEQFRDLQSLRSLNLSKNYISYLSAASFKNLTNLQVLDLQNNRLSQTEFLNDSLWRSLQSLNLQNNKLRDLVPLNNLHDLQVLSISGNQLTNLKYCDHQSDMQSLKGVCVEVPSPDDNCNLQSFIKHIEMNTNVVINSGKYCADFARDSDDCVASSPRQQIKYSEKCPPIEEVCSPKPTAVTPTDLVTKYAVAVSRKSFTMLNPDEIAVGIMGYALCILLISCILLVLVKDHSYRRWQRNMNWEIEKAESPVRSNSVSEILPKSLENIKRVRSKSAGSLTSGLYDFVDSPPKGSPNNLKARKKFQTDVRSPRNVYHDSRNDSRTIPSPTSLNPYSYARNTGSVEAIPWATTLSASTASLMSQKRSQIPSPLLNSSPEAGMAMFDLSKKKPGTLTNLPRRKMAATYKVKQCYRNPGGPSPNVNRRKVQKRSRTLTDSMSDTP